MGKIVACDSKPFNRHNFKGILGVTLTFEDPESFKKEYGKFMDDSFSKVGLTR